MRRLAAILTVLMAVAWVATTAAPHATLGRPSLDSIAAAVADPQSPYYYPRLLREFMGNDTTMTAREFQYFYYGTLFQEDYDPYRQGPDPAALTALAPVYAKNNRSRAERGRMLDYALKALDDNPLDLRQLTNRIFVYEKNGKYDLAKIWQYKLNHLLLVIASSGNGTDPSSAWMVVYPQHEYDFLNLSGLLATAQEFVPPGYDCITVQPRQEGADPETYYFDIAEMLRQYFLKHPSEIVGDDPDDPEADEATADEPDPDLETEPDLDQ